MLLFEVLEKVLLCPESVLKFIKLFLCVGRGQSFFLWQGLLGPEEHEFLVLLGCLLIKLFLESSQFDVVRYFLVFFRVEDVVCHQTPISGHLFILRNKIAFFIPEVRQFFQFFDGLVNVPQLIKSDV